MLHLFLVNPAAGKTDCTAAVEAGAKALSEALGEPFSIRCSAAPGDITRFAREAGQSGEEIRIYACGGDGTLNEAVTGARGYDNLAVTSLPFGSGNDFIKHFQGGGSFYDPLNFQTTEERRIDLMDVNGRVCVGICSAGFDARIGTSINAYRRMPLLGGSRAYTASIVVNLLRGVVRPCRVELSDGSVVDEDMTLCCVCNGTWYGGGYNPIPEASVSDGVLDVLVVRRVSRLTVARVIAAYQKGGYAKYPRLIRRFSTASLRISTPGEEPINIDGELLPASEVKISVLPGALRFFTPAGVWPD